MYVLASVAVAHRQPSTFRKEKSTPLGVMQKELPVKASFPLA